MKRLILQDEGVIYVNPSPGYDAITAIYPSVIGHPSGDTLAFYRLGQGMYSVDGSIAISRLPKGQTKWISEGAIRFPTDSDTPYSYVLAIPGVHRDGSIVLTITRFAVTPDCNPRFNEQTGGLKAGDEQVISISRDIGKTWSTPQRLPISSELRTGINAPVFEMSDGRWMQVIEKWKTWDDTAPLHIRGYAIFSSDKGKSWSSPLDLPWVTDTTRMHSHAQYQQLPDGRIAGTHWTQTLGGQVNLGLGLAFASSDGRTWTDIKPLPIDGQSSSVTGLSDGSLVLCYTVRESIRPGIYVALDEVGDGSFDVAHQAQVWDAHGRDMLGSQHAARYPASHDNIAFGKPHVTALADGQLIASWWCTDSSLVQCRYARFSVRSLSRKSIEASGNNRPISSAPLVGTRADEVRSIRAIDVHAHYGKYQINPGEMHPLRAVFHTGDASCVAQRAAESNVQWTIVSPLHAILPRGRCDAVAGNLMAAQDVRATPGLLQWVVIDPTEPETFDQARQMLAEPWCVGIKIHPESHQYPITRYGDAIFSFAAEHSALVLAHSGDPFSKPGDYVPFANAYPNMRLILAHLGHGIGGNPTEQVAAISKSKHGNLYTDTSSANSILPRLIEWAVKEIGAERILFGTDTPLYHVAMHRARIDHAEIPIESKRMILRENAVKLLGLNGRVKV